MNAKQIAAPVSDGTALGQLVPPDEVRPAPFAVPFADAFWLPLAALGGAMASLCLGSSFAKTLFPVLGATGTSAVRVGVAALLMVSFFRPWRWPLSAAVLRRVVPYGLVLGAMNLAFYLAIARIPLGVAIAIEFTGPLALAVATSRRAHDLLWAGCAALGLAPLFPWQAGVETLDPLGVGFGLVAALCWALYIVVGQRAADLPAGQASALGMLVAALAVVPIGAGEMLPLFSEPRLVLAGLAVGLLSSAIPYSLEMLALRRLPKPTFGTLLSLEPAIGALASWLVLGEHLTPLQGVAIACVMVASVGSVRGVAQKT